MSDMRVLEDHELELVSGGSFWGDIGSAVDDVARGVGKAIGDTGPSASGSAHDNRNGWAFNISFSL